MGPWDYPGASQRTWATEFYISAVFEGIKIAFFQHSSVSYVLGGHKRPRDLDYLKEYHRDNGPCRLG